MTIRKPAATEAATKDQTRRDKLRLKKETVKDLTGAEAQIKGGAPKKTLKCDVKCTYEFSGCA